MVTLDAPSLGQPSDVIILRDAALRHRHKPVALPADESSTNITAHNLLASMNSEGGLIGEEEVKANIDKIRPTSPGKSLSQREFEMLKKALSDGFTSHQLARYIDTARKGRRSRVAERVKASESIPRSQKESPNISSWTLGISSFAAPPPVKPPRQTASRGLHKDRLITEVLRNCWDIPITEEVSSIGEIEMLVKEKELCLLLSERRNLLKMLAERRRAKLDVSRSRSVIRVTADKDTANLVVRDIRSILRNIQYMELDLGPFKVIDDGRAAQAVDLLMLDSIAQITGTEIKLVDDDKLGVHSLGPDSTEADDVRRLLLTSMLRTTESEVSLVCDGPKDLDGALYAIWKKEDLPWIEQKKHWQRFQCAIGRSELDVVDTASLHSGVQSREQTSFEVDRLLGGERFEIPGGKTDAIQGHEDGALRPNEAPTAKPIISNHATLGLTLHETPRQASYTPSTAQALLSARATNRAFSHAAPDIFEAVSSLQETTKTLKEQIRICLRPSPWSSLPRTTITSFPGLEVTLDLSSESKEPRLHAVCATLSEQQVDVMLPYQPADLRFTRRTEFSLEARRPVQSIADFLARSYLNIRGQGRLRTPSTLVVPLPRWALAHADARSDEDVTEVEYLFTGLEHRQTLDIVHEGWRAQYTSVEAGKTGGRRCELRVLMEKGGDVGGEASGALDFGEFYAAAVGLVERLATRTRKAL